MEGQLVSKIPPPQSAGEVYDWDRHAEAALAHPDRAVLAARHVPVSRITSLRSYTRPPFVDEHGNRKVTIHMRNSTTEETHGRKRRYGDVYLQATEYED